MMKSINVSFNPSYHCNFRCSFCYLTKEQLSDKTKTNLDSLKDRLDEILNNGYQVGHIDVYGGEISVLPLDYVLEFMAIISSYNPESIGIITNLSSTIPTIIENPNIYLSVSYDFEFRQNHEHVYKNMMNLDKKFVILTLGIPEILRSDPVRMVEQINNLPNCEGWEIKPYSTNQSNQIKTSYREYEEFIKKIISIDGKNFEFYNEGYIKQSLAKEKNAFSDDHVYITPDCRFAILEFDLNGNEYFKSLNNFDEYLDWTIEEKNRVLLNTTCSNCKYLGNCLSEHLKEVKEEDDGCNGFKGLLDWYSSNR